MQLNTLKPAKGSKKTAKRVGRGVGCTLGKTCGRGHKGQKARAGGYHKVGFEGGQTPLQRRLPKFGFSSRQAQYNDEIRLSELAKVDAKVIDLEALKQAGLLQEKIKSVKVILDGPIDKALHLKGLRVTKGAKAAIESAKGKIEA